VIVRHYGAAPGRARLYDDDGETFQYVRGNFAWYEITTTGETGELKRQRGHQPLSFGRVEWRHISPPK